MLAGKGSGELAESPEPLFLDHPLSTKTSGAGPCILHEHKEVLFS